MAPWFALGPSLCEPVVVRPVVVGGVEVWSMVPSSNLGFFLGPGFPLGLGVDSPKAFAPLFVPLEAAFFLTVSVGGSIAPAVERTAGIGVPFSTLSSVAEDEALVMVLSGGEEDGGFASTAEGASFRRKSCGALSLTMSGPLLVAFRGLALEAFEIWFDCAIMLMMKLVVMRKMGILTRATLVFVVEAYSQARLAPLKFRAMF